MQAYETGDELQARLMQLYFSPAFREAHAAKLLDKRALQAAGREDLERRGKELRGEREVRVESHAIEIGIGVAALALLVLGSFNFLRAPTVSRTEPYRFRVGLKSFPIEHATGAIANYTRSEVRQRHFKQYSQYAHNADEPTVTEVTVQVDEEFTLDEAGRSEPIHFQTLAPDASVVPATMHAGDRRTVLWTTIAGERAYVCFKGPRLGDGHPVTRRAFTQLFPRPNWTAVPALVLGFVIGDLVVASQYSGVLAVFVAYPVWAGVMKLLFWLRAGALGEQLTALAKQLFESSQ